MRARLCLGLTIAVSVVAQMSRFLKSSSLTRSMNWVSSSDCWKHFDGGLRQQKVSRLFPDSQTNATGRSANFCTATWLSSEENKFFYLYASFRSFCQNEVFTRMFVFNSFLNCVNQKLLSSVLLERSWPFSRAQFPSKFCSKNEAFVGRFGLPWKNIVYNKLQGDLEKPKYDVEISRQFLDLVDWYSNSYPPVSYVVYLWAGLQICKFEESFALNWSK